MSDRRRAPRELRTTEPVHRRWLGLPLALALLVLLAVALVDLPREGAPLPAIARQALTESLPRFHSTEPVSAVVYGFRAIDTFGETFLLLAAVVSVIVLTRGRERRRGFVGEERAGREEQEAEDRRQPATAEERTARAAEEEEESERPPAEDPELPDDEPVGSPAPERALAMTVITRTAVRIALPLLAVAGLYLVLLGFAPGGGFQAGGVVLGVILLLYAGFGYHRIAGAVRPDVFEVVELTGALAIVVVLTLGLPLAASFAANWIPLAPQQTIRSGGILQLFSLGEFVEVGTGLTIAVFAVMGIRHEWAPDVEEKAPQEAATRSEGVAR